MGGIDRHGGFDFRCGDIHGKRERKCAVGCAHRFGYTSDVFANCGYVAKHAKLLAESRGQWQLANVHE